MNERIDTTEASAAYRMLIDGEWVAGRGKVLAGAEKNTVSSSLEQGFLLNILEHRSIWNMRPIAYHIAMNVWSAREDNPRYFRILSRQCRLPRR